MFSMPLLAERLRCALSSAAVVALDSLRIAEASGSGSLCFFEDVGAGVSVGEGTGLVGAALEDTAGADDPGSGVGDGADEQPRPGQRRSPRTGQLGACACPPW